MTDQPEGPELWLAVAKVMGIPGYDGSEYIIRRRFDPSNNPADFAAMHQYVRGLGYSVTYGDYEDSDNSECVIAAPHDDGSWWEGLGPDDETALGRAIVEMTR